MGISASDIIPLSHARSNFSELAKEVKGGAEKIITKNRESYVALILINQASRGLDDAATGKVKDARNVIQAIKRRRRA